MMRSEIIKKITTQKFQKFYRIYKEIFEKFLTRNKTNKKHECGNM